MAEDTSSLRQAIDQIMGWPPGGQPGAGGTSGGFVPSAPAPSSAVNLGTSSAISNTIAPAAPDPFASQLAGIQAQNAALQASLTAPAAAPAAAQAAAPGGITYEQQLRNDLAFSGITGAAADDIVSRELVNTGYTSSTAYNPATMALNPDVPQGQARITTSGPSVPTTTVYQPVPNVYGSTAAAAPLTQQERYAAATPSQQARYAERRNG